MKTNETIKTILARRSVRSFTDEPIGVKTLRPSSPAALGLPAA